MTSIHSRRLPLAGLVLCLALGSCSWFHHGGKQGCRERDVTRGAVNRAPLKVPAGFDAPDTRNAVQVPPLAEPERPRSPADPCLSAPPSFKG
jgi:uncharacterized lipoprotein